jgi:chorismate-pyruvate lyase
MQGHRRLQNRKMDHLESPTDPGEKRGFLATANGVDVQSLGLLQRVLLISDGTLTDIVEAAFQEPIQLVKLALDISPARASVEELDLQSGAQVMSREILLRGTDSGSNYVYAKSLIALDALPARLRDELVSTDRPLGRLWVEHKLETRKEILKVWRIFSGEPLKHFQNAEHDGLLARSYRVFSGGRPIMLISEYFPAAR